MSTPGDNMMYVAVIIVHRGVSSTPEGYHEYTGGSIPLFNKLTRSYFAVYEHQLRRSYGKRCSSKLESNVKS